MRCARRTAGSMTLDVMGNRTWKRERLIAGEQRDAGIPGDRALSKRWKTAAGQRGKSREISEGKGVRQRNTEDHIWERTGT